MELLSARPENQATGLENGKAEQLAEASGRVKSKHGGARPGAGAKRKNMGQGPVENQDVVAPVVSQADIDFVKSATKDALGVLDSLISSKIYLAVNGLAPGLEKEAQKFCSQTAIAEKEKDLVSGAMGAIAAKYSILARFAPECALVGWGVSYMARCKSTLNEIKQLAQIIKEHQGPVHADSSPTN